MTGVVERLGHVLGWTGTGLAVFSIIIGVAGAVHAVWTGWITEINSTVVIEAPDQTIYNVVGPVDRYRAEQEAMRALQVFLGLQPADGTEKSWSVFAMNNQSAEDEARMKVAQQRVREETWTTVRARMDRDAGDSLVIGLGAAIFFYLFGRAWRYILSGPRAKKPG
jgi:hypothetical protein